MATSAKQLSLANTPTVVGKVILTLLTVFQSKRTWWPSSMESVQSWSNHTTAWLSMGPTQLTAQRADFLPGLITSAVLMRARWSPEIHQNKQLSVKLTVAILQTKLIITLRTSCGTVYCNRSCLFVCGWVCYHINSKLHASILTKLGL